MRTRAARAGRSGWESSRAGRVRRHAIEWDTTGGRQGGTRGDIASISKEPTHALPLRKDDESPPSRPSLSRARPSLPTPSRPPRLSSAAFPAAASSSFAPYLALFLSLSLSLHLSFYPYQIESLYFASSIISFINLRAFRTL